MENKNIVVKDVNLIINEYNFALSKANQENILLKAYCVELDREVKRLEEELKLFKK